MYMRTVGTNVDVVHDKVEKVGLEGKTLEVHCETCGYSTKLTIGNHIVSQDEYLMLLGDGQSKPCKKW